MKKLNPKQKRFCEEYIIDLNASAAAVRAGYTEKSARVTASKMLTNANIEAYIQSLSAKHTEKTGITADWVLNGIKELTDRLIEMDDPKAAFKGYELGGKYLTLFSDKVDHTSSDGSMTPATFNFVPVGKND